MSTDLKAIMARDERRRRMLHDPDLTGDRLLFALGLDEVIATRKELGRRKAKRHWVADIAALVYGEDSAYHQKYWGKGVIAEDVPRYEPPTPSRTSVPPARRATAVAVSTTSICGPTRSESTDAVVPGR